jgi:hypothetical protein
MDDLESSRSDCPPLCIQLEGGPYGGFDHIDPPEIGFHGGGRVCLSDEDVNISDRDDGDSGRVFSSRHPEVIRWDNREARIIEDAPDGDGVADAYEGGSRLDPRSGRSMPHGGRQLSWFRQQICHGYRCMAVCGRG